VSTGGKLTEGSVQHVLALKFSEEVRSPGRGVCVQSLMWMAVHNSGSSVYRK